jgi:hypothetical protein
VYVAIAWKILANETLSPLVVMSHRSAPGLFRNTIANTCVCDALVPRIETVRDPREIKRNKKKFMILRPLYSWAMLSIIGLNE